METADIGVCVGLANASVTSVGRRIDYVHMPVPSDRSDDAYFEPLSLLDIGATKLYLGLLHAEGVTANLARVVTAGRHTTDFGVAAECGMARVPVDQVETLLQARQAVGTQLQIAAAEGLP